MIALNNGDKLRADASVENKIDYTIHGIVADIPALLNDGQMAGTEADIYISPSDSTMVTTIICVNTHTVAVTCNIYLKSSGETSRRIIPKDIEIGIGQAMVFDGSRIFILGTGGNVVTLGAGTAAIGKLAVNSGVDIGDVDIASQPADTFVAEDGALGKGILLQGDDGTDRKNVLVDTAGHLQVDVLSGGVSNDSVEAEGSAAAKGTQISLDDGVDSHYAQANAAGDLKVTLDSEAVVLGVGSAAVGKLAANSGVDIGDVDVLSLPALPAGTNNIGDVDIASALPTGANAIGKLAANSGVDIGDVDVASQPADIFAAEDAALGKGILLQGDDGTDRKNVAVDANGNVQVDIVGALPAGSAEIGIVNVGMLKGTWTCISININTATTTELKAAVAGHTYTVITVSLTIAAGNNLTWKSASSAISGPMDFGQAGEPHGWQASLWPCGLKCVAGEALNLTTSTTGQVSGFICVLDES